MYIPYALYSEASLPRVEGSIPPGNKGLPGDEHA